MKTSFGNATLLIPSAPSSKRHKKSRGLRLALEPARCMHHLCTGSRCCSTPPASITARHHRHSVARKSDLTHVNRWCPCILPLQHLWATKHQPSPCMVDPLPCTVEPLLCTACRLLATACRSPTLPDRFREDRNTAESLRRVRTGQEGQRLSTSTMDLIHAPLAGRLLRTVLLRRMSGRVSIGRMLSTRIHDADSCVFPSAVIAESDLSKITKKQIRLQLESKYGGSLASKKDFLNATIEKILAE